LADLNQAFILTMKDVDGAPLKDWLALQQNATGLCLSHYRPLFGVELATSSAAEVSLTCAWQPTIPSQGSQSFTQFVDFGGESLSLMPPGNSERQDADERLG
jgi:hypothetical protein